MIPCSNFPLTFQSGLLLVLNPTLVFQEFFLKVHSSSLQLLRLYRQMSAPEIVGERLHLLLCNADGSLCGHRRKVSSLRAGLVLFLWFPLPSVSHQEAVTARRLSVLAAAARAEDAGCRDAYDGASSPENRNCCLPGKHRAQGRRMPADHERNRKVAGACCGRHRRGRPPPTERFCQQRKDALTRDWGPRRLRHHLQHVNRSVTSLAVAMAPGKPETEVYMPVTPPAQQLRASSVDLRPGRYQLMRRVFASSQLAISMYGNRTWEEFSLQRGRGTRAWGEETSGVSGVRDESGRGVFGGGGGEPEG